jgi:hypothetical protein
MRPHSSRCAHWLRRWARTPLSAPMRRADDDGGQPDHGRAQRAFAAEALPIRMTMGPARSKDWWFISEIVPPQARPGRACREGSAHRRRQNASRRASGEMPCTTGRDDSTSHSARFARTHQHGRKFPGKDLASQAAAAAKKYLSALQRGRPGIAVSHPAQIERSTRSRSRTTFAASSMLCDAWGNRIVTISILPFHCSRRAPSNGMFVPKTMAFGGNSSRSASRSST